MRTSLTLLALLGLMVLIPFGCDTPAGIYGPESTLIDRLKERFDRNDYVDPSVASRNPFNKAGKDARAVCLKISRKLMARSKDSSGLALRSNSNRTVLRENNFGTSDSEALAAVSEEITSYYAQQSVSFSAENVAAVNRRLSQVQYSEDGVAGLLTEAKDQQLISSFQYEVLRIELNELVSAPSDEKAIAVIATVEDALLNSPLASEQKNWLLEVNATARNVAAPEGGIASNATRGLFRKTAAVVPVLVEVVVNILIGGIVGGLIGIVTCTQFGTLPNFNCVLPWIISGMAIGALPGVGLIYDELYLD